jgi:hypothetical protein
LFNQSFDSLADVAYFPVDSSLQNDSFGMARSSSLLEPDPGSHILRPIASMENQSQQLLHSSVSGALTLGYSPVNSFGTAAPPIPPSASGLRRGGGSAMMVVGGSDYRAASPNQVLGTLGSYSIPRPPPGQDLLDDCHVHMSTSFGTHSIAFARSYGTEPIASNIYGQPHPSMRTSPSHESNDSDPIFYLFLRKYKIAFASCLFLLPGLKTALLEPSISNDKADERMTAIIDAVRVRLLPCSMHTSQ